jgi:hypothetical protein
MPNRRFSPGQYLIRKELIGVIEPLARATYRVKKKCAPRQTEAKGNIDGRELWPNFHEGFSAAIVPVWL